MAKQEKISPSQPSEAGAARDDRAHSRGDGPENWDQRVGFLMHDVSRLRRTVFDEYMRPLGVTRSQWWVLAHVSRNDGMSQSDLAAVLDIGKAALGCLVDRLEVSELVTRTPDSADRRVKRVYLSPRGRQLVNELSHQSQQMSERVLNGLDPEERRTLAALLTKVKDNLRQIKGEADPGKLIL